MQVQAMTYFNELVKCRSIRQAAQNLGVSPTAISRQLENLEYHFDAVLVERGARGIELTAAGEVVAAKVRTALRAFEQAQQHIDDLRGLQRGEVSVHVNGAAGGAILAGVLAEFSRKFPSVSVTVQEASAGDALGAVAAGDTDMALTMFTPNAPRLISRCKLRVKHCAILSPDHPAAGVSEIGIEHLSQYPLSLPDRSYSLRRALEERYREQGRTIGQTAFTTASMTVQKELARLGAAILILPAISVERDIEHGGLLAKPLAACAAVDTDLKLTLAPDRPLSFAAEKFASHLESRLVQAAGTGHFA